MPGESPRGNFGIRPVKAAPWSTKSLPRLHWQDKSINEHLLKGTPVVLTGGCPLASSVLHWSADYLSRNLPNVSQADWPVHYTPSDVRSVTRIYGEGLGDGGITSMAYSEFRALLAARVGPPPPSSKAGMDDRNIYLQVLLKWARGGGNYSRRSLGDALDAEFNGLGWEWLSDACGHIGSGHAQLEACQMWHSHGGVETPLHYDGSNNLIAQLRGRKKVLLFPPSSSFRLYPYPVGGAKDNYSLIADLESPSNARRFPAFAGLVGYSAILHPGDVLFLPMYWWHRVTQPDERSENLSLNFWLSSHSGQRLEHFEWL